LHSRRQSANIFEPLALGCRECQFYHYDGYEPWEVFFVNLRPLGDRLVVEHVEQADKSAGGVFLPDTAKEKPQEGKVLAIGTGRTLDNGQKLPMDVKVGDRIIYSKYSGSEIKLEGTEYLIISEKDVLAVFTDSKVPAGVK
jgi:chaperonin GroES